MAERPSEKTLHLTTHAAIMARLDAIQTELTLRSEGVRPKHATVALRALVLGIEVLEGRLGLLRPAAACAANLAPPDEAVTTTSSSDAVVPETAGPEATTTS